MESFTGPEIAALLMTDRVICSRDIFSDALEQQVVGMSPMMRSISSYEHWIKGTYIIYSVENDKADITLPLSTQSALSSLRSKLNNQLEISLQGRSYRVAAQKSLEQVSDDTEALSQALQSLSTPAEVVLSSTTPITSADDSIAAVNLQRRVAQPVRKSVFENTLQRVAAKYPRVREVEVQHFIGGPVEPEEIGICIVTGRLGCLC